jgi:YHS domain-containing protein
MRAFARRPKPAPETSEPEDPRIPTPEPDPPPEAPSHPPGNGRCARDPVCRGLLETDKTVHHLFHRGVDYHFCSETCFRQFRSRSRRRSRRRSS